MWLRLRKVEKKKKFYPFFLLENPRPLSPRRLLDFLSVCLGLTLSIVTIFPQFMVGGVWGRGGNRFLLSSVQFSSATQSGPNLCGPMDCSMPGLPVHHQLLEFAQTHVHCVGDAIQPSHPLLSPSPPALNLSQHQGLFQWVSSSHQVAKVLELLLQHQSFQRTPRADLL